MEMPHLRIFLIRGRLSLEGNTFAQIRHFDSTDGKSNKAIKAKHLATGAKACGANGE